MLPAQRLPYSAIVDRPPLRLPGGARVVVWPIVNVEVWDIGRAMPRQVLPPPTGQTMLPDLPHWAWHEYGMRVGFWRLKAALDRLDIKASLCCNGRVCEDYPRVAEAARDAPAGATLRLPPGRFFLPERLCIDKPLTLTGAGAAGAGQTEVAFGYPGAGLSFSGGGPFAAEGIAFVGPTPDNIRAFGLKHTARDLAKAFGVPLAPGTDLLKDAEAALTAANSIGYPVILKASAGGGGIGMRVCEDAAAVTDAFAQVTRLAGAGVHRGESTVAVARPARRTTRSALAVRTSLF